jgi:hypothetical protein
MLTTSTGTGVPARGIAAIAPRADPGDVVPVRAGIAVSIQIMVLAISACRRAGRPGRRTRPWPARLVGPNPSAAHPDRAAHVTLQKTAEIRSAGRGPGRASPRQRRREPRGGEDRGEQPGRQRRDHYDC